MGRQAKVTESYAVKKSQGLRLTVKRKILAEEEDEENVVARCDIAPPVGVDIAKDFDNYQTAKNALHLSRPGTLIAREEQLNEVYSWLDERLKGRLAGSIYISGAPGTGKTAVVLQSIQQWVEDNSSAKPKGPQPLYKLVINCMNLVSPNEIYEQMAPILRADKKAEGGSTKEKVFNKLMSRNYKSKMMVLVLDEMDQLVNVKGTEVVYSLFKWSRTPGSRLIIIGIANALDLTVRHLPLLAAIHSPSPAASPKASTPKGRRPKKTESTRASELSQEISSTMKVLNFAPYDRSDIEKILEARLTEIGSNIFEPTAIKFVAAKVAATTGDMRKALNACKLALDAVEKQQRQILKSTADDGFNFTSPKKCCILREKITVGTVAKVFAPTKDDGPFPLQQMIMLATLLRIYKTAQSAPISRQPKLDGVTHPIPMSQAYDEYRKICSVKGFSAIDRSDIVSVCSMLQDRSLVTVVENMSGAGAKSKKFGTLSSANKTGFLFSLNAVEKIIMECDMKSIICD